MSLLIAYGALALGVSFLCSLVEASLLSVPRSHAEALSQRGGRLNGLLLRLKDRIDRPLAAILTLNTVAHTVGAAGVGAQAAVLWENNAVGIASAIMTFLILVFSEIIPKTLGAVHAKSLGVVTALIVYGMIVICYPLVIMLEGVNRLVGYQRHKELVSRAELSSAVRLGLRGGALTPREFRIASNLFLLQAIKIKDILTPRTVLFTLPVTATVDEVLAEHQPLRFARIPVHEDTVEHVVGYVSRFDIHQANLDDKTRSLKDLKRDITAVPETASVQDVLEQMLQRQEHIVLVVDEFGGVEGIATLEDVYETLLGAEVVDETDPVIDMQVLAKRLNRRRNRGPAPAE